MAVEATQILKALKGTQPGAKISENDPQYAGLLMAYRNWEMSYLDNVVDGTRFTWSPRDISMNNTPAAFRYAIQTEAAMINITIKTYVNAWKRQGLKGAPPGYSPELEKIFEAIGLMDPETGQISGDVPLQLRDVVPSPASPTVRGFKRTARHSLPLSVGSAQVSLKANMRHK